MLIGTYVRHGKYVTAVVQAGTTAGAPAALVLEAADRPGQVGGRVDYVFDSLDAARRHGEGLVLSRAGWLGAEAEGLVGSPVSRVLAKRMFRQPETKRFVHMTARRTGR